MEIIQASKKTLIETYYAFEDREDFMNQYEDGVFEDLTARIEPGEQIKIKSNSGYWVFNPKKDVLRRNELGSYFPISKEHFENNFERRE